MRVRPSALCGLGLLALAACRDGGCTHRVRAPSLNPLATATSKESRAMVPSNLPGAPEIPAALPARLQAALSAKGAGYVPRTHHLVGKAPKYLNRLVLESSPYLLQHAHNPVNWYAWGEEAFADARRLGR